jgi:hypothetical protein
MRASVGKHGLRIRESGGQGRDRASAWAGRRKFHNVPTSSVQPITRQQ